jgi:hypothetical protein
MEGKRGYNLKGLSVYIAMPVKGDIPPETMMATIDTMDALRIKGIPFRYEMFIGGTICDARSHATAKLLASDCNRLLFIDSDMVWTPNDVIRMLAMSTAMDIVLAPYPTRSDPVQFFIKCETGAKLPVNEHGCAEIDGSGLGFTIISRPVLEALSEKAPVIQYMAKPAMPHVFQFAVSDGQFRGEDIKFFTDAKALGFKCWMDPSIVLGHIGRKTFRAPLLDSVKVTDGHMVFAQ